MPKVLLSYYRAHFPAIAGVFELDEKGDEYNILARLPPDLDFLMKSRVVNDFTPLQSKLIFDCIFDMKSAILNDYDINPHLISSSYGTINRYVKKWSNQVEVALTVREYFL